MMMKMMSTTGQDDGTGEGNDEQVRARMNTGEDENEHWRGRQ